MRPFDDAVRLDMQSADPNNRSLVARGSRMNPKRVIILMTLAVCAMLGSLMILFFGGFPPWPITICFAVSHLTFCFFVARVKPYTGPYKRPLVDPDPLDWAG